MGATLPTHRQRDAPESAVDLGRAVADNRGMQRASTISSETQARSDHRDPCAPKGPPFWEDWRGQVPDEEIEFVIFEEFCSSWE
jgi:hypothetical protein